MHLVLLKFFSLQFQAVSLAVIGPELKHLSLRKNINLQKNRSLFKASTNPKSNEKNYSTYQWRKGSQQNATNTYKIRLEMTVNETLDTALVAEMKKTTIGNLNKDVLIKL